MLENASAVRHGSEGRSRANRHGSESPPPRCRSRSTNDPRYLPKETNPRAMDRRRRDLVRTLLAALGPAGANDLALIAVRKAAELTVAAEMARANALNGVPIDMLALVRLENAARRAQAALGIKIEKPSRALAARRARWAAQAQGTKATKTAAKAARRREAAKTATARDKEPLDDEEAKAETA
jgi:hypothetical protein